MTWEYTNVAKAAYEAYVFKRARTHGRFHADEPFTIAPSWNELPEEDREGWIAAVKEVMDLTFRAAMA